MWDCQWNCTVLLSSSMLPSLLFWQNEQWYLHVLVYLWTLHLYFRMWLWFRIWTKILADRRIWRKKGTDRRICITLFTPLLMKRFGFLLKLETTKFAHYLYSHSLKFVCQRSESGKVPKKHMIKTNLPFFFVNICSATLSTKAQGCFVAPLKSTGPFKISIRLFWLNHTRWVVKVC